MVRKHWLIVTNGILWLAAGFNIARIGVRAAFADASCVWLWFIPVFAAFGTMFTSMVRKNTMRIMSMKEKAPLCKFLTPKGYIIIAFMMTLGFTLRGIGKLPDSFFAFFYTGLGSALSLAGVLFLLKGFSPRVYSNY